MGFQDRNSRIARTGWSGSSGGGRADKDDGEDGGISLRTNAGSKEWKHGAAGEKRTPGGGWGAGGILKKASQVTRPLLIQSSPGLGKAREGFC